MSHGLLSKIIHAISGLLRRETKAPPVAGAPHAVASSQGEGAGSRSQATGSHILSPRGIRLLTATLQELVDDERLRAEWEAFNAQLLRRCLQATPQGYMVDREALRAFLKPENEALFRLGARVYTEAHLRLSASPDPDRPVFDQLARFYTDARIASHDG